MSYFAVTREAGRAWTEGAGVMEQPALTDHAAFMNALAEQGVVLFGGPLAGTERGRIRALLIVSAEGEAEVRRSLADDPWEASEQIRTVSVEPWTVFTGEARLSSA